MVPNNLATPPTRSLGQRVAVVGVGVMGSALARGLVSSGALDPSLLVLQDADRVKAQKLAADLGDTPTYASTPEAATAGADIVLIAVKPGTVPFVLTQIGPGASDGSKLIISVAAGLSLSKLQDLLGPNVPVIRAMPNTPATVLAGATAIARGERATPEHAALAITLFSAVGLAVEVDEKLMDAVTGLSGSGPAYVFLMIEALIDAGVKEGLPRETARLLAAQTVYGAAKMIMDTGAHPAALKDNVTTPGGTTIAGLAALERTGLRASLIDAVEAAARRSRELT